MQHIQKLFIFIIGVTWHPGDLQFQIYIFLNFFFVDIVMGQANVDVNMVCTTDVVVSISAQLIRIEENCLVLFKLPYQHTYDFIFFIFKRLKILFQHVDMVQVVILACPRGPHILWEENLKQNKHLMIKKIFSFKILKIYFKNPKRILKIKNLKAFVCHKIKKSYLHF